MLKRTVLHSNARYTCLSSVGLLAYTYSRCSHDIICWSRF